VVEIDRLMVLRTVQGSPVLRGARIFVSLQLIQSYYWPKVILKQPKF